MNLRRHILETATILLVAVAIALVSNTLASRERKLKLPGDYPNATTVGSSSKVNGEPAAAPAKPQGPVGTSVVLPPSKKSPVSSSPAAPAADRDLLARFPPHPDKPYVEIPGEDAARLHTAGVPFLDARRTSLFEDGHVAGARSVSVWESDVDEKVMALMGEQDGAKPLVLYCSGGDCEDSHLLAQKLWGAGFNDVLVYRDGFPDWVKRGGAVRRGAAP